MWETITRAYSYFTWYVTYAIAPLQRQKALWSHWKSRDRHKSKYWHSSDTEKKTVNILHSQERTVHGSCFPQSIVLKSWINTMCFGATSLSRFRILGGHALKHQRKCGSCVLYRVQDYDELTLSNIPTMISSCQIFRVLDLTGIYFYFFQQYELELIPLKMGAVLRLESINVIHERHAAPFKVHPW